MRGSGRAPRPARPAAPFPRSLPRLGDVHGASSIFYRDTLSNHALGASPRPPAPLPKGRAGVPGPHSPSARRGAAQELRDGAAEVDGAGGGSGDVLPAAPPAGGAGARPGAISLAAAREEWDRGSCGSAKGFAMPVSPSSSACVPSIQTSSPFSPCPFCHTNYS